MTVFSKESKVHGIGIVEDDILNNPNWFSSPHDSSGFELRRSDRTPLSVPVHYKVKPRLPWNAAKSIDFSKGGIRIQVPQLLSLDSEVELELKLPGETQITRVKGLVVWVRRTSHEGCYECGIAFKDLKKTQPNQLISFFAERICQLVAERGKDMTCRPADATSDLKAAFGLVYKEYLKRGYCDASPSGMHYSYFSLLPDSRTFVLKKEGALWGTISLVPDSSCGLPMDSLFAEEMASFRKPGRRLAEVTLLALDQDRVGGKVFSLMDFQKMACLFKLIKVLFDYARFQAGVTDLVICAHPKHEALYRYLGYESMGAVKPYPGACGKPAQPMHLDIIAAMSSVSLDKGRGFYFLKERTPEEILTAALAWTPGEIHDFLFEYDALWHKMSYDVQDHFKDYYRTLVKRIPLPS